jgi:SWI/SNF-related matrix-associated actin-dependent regulator of chromatin subfamily B protein 1
MDYHQGSNLTNNGEHLVNIQLKFKDFSDQFEWDINNPDNQPEEFAAMMVSDLGLEPILDFTLAIAYEI